MFDISFINKPLGYVMKFLAELFNGNFAAAVLVFTLLINLVLIPLSIKGQKSTVQQLRIKPKLDELKARYGDDKQKYNAAMQKLYQDEKVSMSGGCLPMVIRLVIMLCIYNLILSPITYMASADKIKVKNVQETVYSQMEDTLKEKNEKKYKELDEKIGWSDIKSSFKNNQLGLVKLIDKDTDAVEEIMGSDYKKIEKDYTEIVAKFKDANIDFKLFGNDGLVLYNTPKFTFNFSEAQLLWIIPFGAFLAQILTSIISMKISKKNNPDAPSMAAMMLTMPLISLFIGFGLPGGVGFYWICSSLIGGFIQAGVQYFYGPHRMLASTRAKELSKRGEFELKQIDKLSNSASSEE